MDSVILEVFSSLNDSVMILYSCLFMTAIAFDIFTALPEEKEPFLLRFDFITWVILKNKCKLWFSCWSMPQLTAFNSMLLFFHHISSSWIILLTFSLYYIYLKINKEAILGNFFFFFYCVLFFFCNSDDVDISPRKTKKQQQKFCTFLVSLQQCWLRYLLVNLLGRLYVDDRIAYTIEVS